MQVWVVVKSYDWGEEYGSGWEVDRVYLDGDEAAAYATRMSAENTGSYGYRFIVEKKDAIK